MQELLSVHTQGRQGNGIWHKRSPAIPLQEANAMRILSPDSKEYQEIAALWDKWNKALKEGKSQEDYTDMCKVVTLKLQTWPCFVGVRCLPFVAVF